VLTLDARVLDGRVSGSTDVSGDLRHLSATLSGLDVTRAVALRKSVGPTLGGRLGGTVDLDVPFSGNNPDLSKAGGRVELALADASVSGQLAIPGFATALALPRVALGAMTLALKVEQGRAAVEKLESTGGDAELSTEGVVVTLQPRLEFAPVSGRARLRISPAFWQQQATSNLKPVVDAALAQSRVGDGSYQFQVAGTLGRPQLTPGARAGGAPGAAQ
jgi:type II secretion system protein N